MIQKIIQIGNSTGIIIPKQILDSLDLKPGNEVLVEKDTTEDILTISKSGQNKKKVSVNPAFFSLLEKVNKNYGAALKELATK